MKEEHTTSKIVEVKTTPKLPYVNKMKNVGEWENGHAFLGVYLPQKSKLIFPKNGFSLNSNFMPILLPSPCNNYFNEFLAELNDWVNEP